MRPDKLERQILGSRIKELRKRRGMTQRELAIEAGLSESALRSYELGDRNPKPIHITMISRALKVRPEVFADTTIRTNMEVIHLIFNLEERYKMHPIESERAITSDDRDIAKAFRDWGDMRAKMQRGEITKEEYEDWKDTYTPYIDPLED